MVGELTEKKNHVITGAFPIPHSPFPIPHSPFPVLVMSLKIEYETIKT